MTFQLNLETQKIEISTGGKAKWNALPTDVRDHIKRFCNWSRTAEAWVSKGPNPWWANKLPEWGFTDAGQIGEKLTLEERVEKQQERAAERSDRYDARADKAEELSTRLGDYSRSIIAGIPAGQPILVGHHSEKRHRRALDRSWNVLGKAVEASKKAEYYTRRAETAARTAEGAQLKNPRYLGNRIREREADIRKYEARLEGKWYQHEAPGTHEVSDESRERYTEALEEKRAELAFYQKCREECGITLYTKESLKGMTHVMTRWGWSEIVRLNPKSVSCVNTIYQTEESNRKFPFKTDYAEIKDAKRIDKSAPPAENESAA